MEIGNIGDCFRIVLYNTGIVVTPGGMGMGGWFRSLERQISFQSSWKIGAGPQGGTTL
jgi:hypothetical protein